MHGKSPHGSFGLKFSLLKFKSIKSLKYLKWNEKSLVFKRSLIGDRKWPNMITGLSKQLALRPGAIVFSSQASKIYHCLPDGYLKYKAPAGP